MFERLPASHAHRLERRDPVLAALSLLLHLSVAGSLLLSSYLALPEISIPRLRPILSVPILFSIPGAPAPRLGSREAAPPASATVRLRPPDPRTPPSQPKAIPSALPEAEPDTATAGDGSAPGIGDPDGVPGGDPFGKKGATCVGEGCDPDGPIGPGPGLGGSGEAAEAPIFRPGIDSVTEPVIIESSKVLPRYPEVARRAGVTGRVILEAVIQTDGTVASVQVLRETPSRLGFAEAAAEAVSHWRYRPGTQFGVPVAVYFTVIVDFTLSR